MTQDQESLALYRMECENILEYALRLLCPLHGVTAVGNAMPVCRIRGEVGELVRMDFIYALTCGCKRRKDLHGRYD